MSAIFKTKEKALKEIEAAKDSGSLQAVRLRYLGRKGELTDILRSLKNKSLSERRHLGFEANKLQKELEYLFVEKEKKIARNRTPISAEDLTRPGEEVVFGHLHPLTCVEWEVREIFSSMNFTIVDGPEVETEYYNFDALNIPPHHPARDMWDTFWLKPTHHTKPKTINRHKLSVVSNKFLLRTHTSPVQVRYMEKHKPPFQIVVPGRVFRYEATDASHEINFYQLEGLMVGDNVSLSNFKFTIEEFFKKFFEDRKIRFRFRPSYFPFVEPGLEVDIKLATSDKRQAAWLEVMGAGMVHPKVFEAVKYKNVQGFAFGVGIDRLAMIKYGIPDVRLFYNGDLRFVRQF